jgi:hypothetical protein
MTRGTLSLPPPLPSLCRSDQLWEEFVAEPLFQSDFNILSMALGRWRQWRLDKVEGRREWALEQVRA